MSAPREEIAVALLAKLQALVDAEPPLLTTASRVFRSWDDVGGGECPAAFLIADGETRTKRRGLPDLIAIKSLVVIYCKNDQGRDGVPATQLNAALSAVEDALQRQPSEGQAPLGLFPQNPDFTFGTTLGGLCYSCGIAETVEIYEGFQGADAVCVIPILSLTTDRKGV